MEHSLAFLDKIAGDELEDVRYLLMGLGFSGLVALCFWAQQRGRSLTLLDRLKGLGDMSYTLYVVHVPVLLFVYGVICLHWPDRQWVRAMAMCAGIAAGLALPPIAYPYIERPSICWSRRSPWSPRQSTQRF